MICSMALVCLVDLRKEALKCHIDDFELFLCESVRVRALWSESDPMWCVLRLKEGKRVGVIKM